MESHWAFQAVVRPAVPEAGDWGAGEVDAFIAAAQRGRGLSASPRADRRTLIRRLYLVLHGMPPTPEEVEAFVADRGPGAWGRLVERALASPRYGERFARHWLDIVRFAESNGFETNRERPNAYRYRDYVIAAFNGDKPYDQFIKEQLAGDASGADVATGFLVAGPYDIVKSPDPNLTLMQRQDELADMVNASGTTFLGITLGCARCHDHKFDPVSQRDYYALQAVFAGVSYGDRPVRREPGEAGRRRLAELKADLAAAEAELVALRERAAVATGEKGLREPVSPTFNRDRFPPAAARFLRFTVGATNGGEPCLDELVALRPDGSNASLGAKPSSSGDLRGYAIHKLAHINDGQFGNARSWISDTAGAGWVQLEFAEAEEIAGVEWARDREGRFADRLATVYRIEVSADGVEWREVASSGDRVPFGAEAAPDAFVAQLPADEAERAGALLAEVGSARAEVAALEEGQPAWVGNFSQPGATHVLYRGDPMAPREEVGPDAIAALGGLGLESGAAEQRRRLALAEWIASAENPLTARVMANRVWGFVFGAGIVETPSDFGGNGVPPTHPELLDWLAAELVDSGWSVKHLVRLMVESETFQQRAVARPDMAASDAGARFLWRFPPRRLEAEAIRDSVLAAAGTLDLRMGGPGFYLLDVDRENVVHYHPKEETGPAEWRRMIYLFKVRQEQDAVFGAFDCPDGGQAIPARSRSTTPLQALNLFNSRFTLDQAERFASRLGEEAGGAVQAQVARAFALLYGRPPDAAELADAEQFVATHGLAAFCRAMFNTNEFLFVP